MPTPHVSDDLRRTENPRFEQRDRQDREERIRRPMILNVFVFIFAFLCALLFLTHRHGRIKPLRDVQR